MKLRPQVTGQQQETTTTSTCCQSSCKRRFNHIVRSNRNQLRNGLATQRSNKMTTKFLTLLLPLCLVLAFTHQLQLTAAIQAGEQHVAAAPAADANQPPTGPMLSMGSESSSALESSAALAGDDLIAAESSQSPEAAEHKSFTSAQVIRQVSFRSEMKSMTRFLHCSMEIFHTSFRD